MGGGEAKKHFRLKTKALAPVDKKKTLDDASQSYPKSLRPLLNFHCRHKDMFLIYN
jgi:hypothetical protein